MLNDELSQAENYFVRESKFKESYLKFKKAEKKANRLGRKGKMFNIFKKSEPLRRFFSVDQIQPNLF